MFEDIFKRLKFFKCDISEEEKSIIDFILNKTLLSINSLTNQNYTFGNIPRGLYYVLVDKVVGEYLFLKKNTNSLKEYDFSPLVKEIQEGDTRIVYDNLQNTENSLDSIINFLINGKDEEILKYRRLEW